MNLDNINLLSQKVDGVLSTVRNLRQEVATLKQALSGAKSELQDKNLLLENATAQLADCKAALDARANQAAAQDESINQKQAEIDTLKSQIAEQNNALAEKAANLEIKARELDSKNSEIEKLNADVEDLNNQIAGKDAAIERLNADLADKTNCIEKMGETIQAQGDEINEAREKFSQLLSTIENELGTEFPVDHSFEPDSAEKSISEPTTEATPDVAQDEPTLDFNQITDDDQPIEVHGANEKENDLFSAGNGGPQNGFFG